MALHSAFTNPGTSIPGTKLGKYTISLLITSELLVKWLLEVSSRTYMLGSQSYKMRMCVCVCVCVCVYLFVCVYKKQKNKFHQGMLATAVLYEDETLILVEM